MSSNATFNLRQPAQPNSVYSYVDEGLNCSVSWSPHPDLIPGVRDRLVEAVGRLPRSYLLPPFDGELFESFQAAEDRAFGYSLAAGFQIVRGSGSTAVRKNLLCIHHGTTQNHRGLSETVVRDPEDSKIIVSTRKRDDTKLYGKNCLWRCFLVPFVSIDEGGNRLEQWILRYGKNRVSTLPTTTHSHELAQNALIYPEHRKGLPAFAEAVPQATAMRDSFLPFRQAERILHGQGLKIDRKAYYNLARGKAMESSSDGLLALVSVLERDRWTYRTFWEFTYNDVRTVTKQVLKAVFFTNDELMKLARRFTPDWMIQMDGTFNTNRIRMPLIDVLGVTNTGHSFIFAFCFVTSESSDNWGFTLQCLERVVYEGLPLPRVVLADQGLGLRTVFQRVWPCAVLQFCEWHAAQNIKARLAKQRYKREERDELMELVWKYLWSATEQELEANRTVLKTAVRPAESEYIEKYWVPKEKQLIRVYTTMLPNLNCFSTQRDEGMHPMVKTVLNHQLRLDDAVQRLTTEMKLAAERLQELEQRDRVRNRRLLEANVWYLIREHVASWALIKLLEEYKRLESLKRVNEPVGPLCTCSMVERFGLPCYHDLERAYDEALPLPLTLIHSRWWYAAGIEVRGNWRPSYGVQPVIQQSLQLKRPSHEIVDATNELLQFRDSLNSELQQRLDEAHVQATRAILRDVQLRKATNLLVPPMLPPLVQSSWNRHAKSHDKTMKRMLTEAEAATRDADKQEKLETEAYRLQGTTEATIDDELPAGIDTAAAESDSESSAREVNEVVFAMPISPTRPITPEVLQANRKRPFTLVMRTPDKPRAAPVAPTTPSIPITSEAQGLHLTPLKPVEIPVSTAPARLDGRTRREGKNSEYIRAMMIERGRGRGGRGRGGIT
jgi:hypothetical protein